MPQTPLRRPRPRPTLRQRQPLCGALVHSRAEQGLLARCTIHGTAQVCVLGRRCWRVASLPQWGAVHAPLHNGATHGKRPQTHCIHTLLWASGRPESRPPGPAGCGNRTCIMAATASPARVRLHCECAQDWARCQHPCSSCALVRRGPCPASRGLVWERTFSALPAGGQVPSAAAFAALAEKVTELVQCDAEGEPVVDSITGGAWGAVRCTLRSVTCLAPQTSGATALWLCLLMQQRQSSRRSTTPSGRAPA